jgi:hypothetical protein
MGRFLSGLSIWFTVLSALSVLFAASPALAQNASKDTGKAVAPRVDKRIELTSIVSRLAGYNEYNNYQFKQYADDVDRHFAPFKNHPVVAFAKQVREKNKIGFDAVPSLAVHLNPPPALTPRVDFSTSVLDTRWGKADAEKYAALLKQFYTDANCAAFFQEHAEMYRTAEQRFQTTLRQVDLTWYKRFYGEQPAGTFNLILGLLNGPGNFGPRVVHLNGTEDLYAVMGTWNTDKEGLPLYDDAFLPTIIHEYNHSFVNKLIEKNASLFERSGTALQHEFAEQMRQQSYAGWKTVVQESLVRACVVQYLKKNSSGKAKAQIQLAEEEARSFLWTGKLVDLLDEYENNRKMYPTLESFIGQIAHLFDTLPAQTADLKKSFALKQPKIVSVAPFQNNASLVDEGIQEIRITFDRPMLKRTGFQIIDTRNPFISPPTFTADGKTLVGQVKLAPNSEFGLKLRSFAFRSADGYPLAEDFPLYFTTRGFVSPPKEAHFGYKQEGKQITFLFTRPDYLTAKIESVSVAGEFNNWQSNAEGFQLKKAGEDTYQLTLNTDQIGKPGEKKQFNFVVNTNLWLEPARQALNVVKKGRGYGRLVIELVPEP